MSAAPDPASRESPLEIARPRGVRRWIVVILSIAISAALVIWILGSLDDPEALWDSIREASLPLLAAIVPISLASHWLRATRWRRFLGMPVSRFASFAAVMLGYSVNVVVPRGGEVARIVDMNRSTAVPFPRLIATLLTERVLDVILLLGFLGVSLAIEGPRIEREMPAVAGAASGALLLAAIGLGAVVAVAVGGRAFVRLAASIAGRVHPGLGRRVDALGREAVEGFAFLRRPRDAAWALTETVGIWLLYWATVIVGLEAFDLLGEIGLAGGTVAFSMTAASVLVPSQGAIGVYHKLGQDTLHGIYGIPSEVALAWVTTVHALLFLLVGGLGGAAIWFSRLLLVGRRRKRLDPEPPAGR